MAIKLSIPTSCAAYLGETEGMDKLHGVMRRLWSRLNFDETQDLSLFLRRFLGLEEKM